MVIFKNDFRWVYWNILLFRGMEYPVGVFPTILSVSYYLHYNGNLLKRFTPAAMRVHFHFHVIFLV